MNYWFFVAKSDAYIGEKDKEEDGAIVGEKLNLEI